MSDTDREKFSLGHALAYSSGLFSDVLSYQFFTFLIFTFYFSIIQIPTAVMTVGWIIWSVWNALNDPMWGIISDRTNTKWGKRRPYIIASIVPLCIIVILLWTPLQITIPGWPKLSEFLYFLFIIIAFDTIYTMFSINQTSLFPEMFQSLEVRGKVNNVRQIFSVIALIFAFIVPTFFFEPGTTFTNPVNEPNYFNAGVFIAIVMFIGALIMIIWGIKEKPEFKVDKKETPSFFRSIKITLKNRAFVCYAITALANWYVFGMLPTIVPLYGEYVLNIMDTTLQSILLGVAFLSAAIFTFVWRFVTHKIGLRKGFMISMVVFIITLFPFMFIGDFVSGIIAFFFVGAGLAGSLFFRDPLVGAVADQDELNTGVRREGSFYGVNALVIRLSTIFIFISIGSVFESVGWAVFDPLADPELGLRLLMFLFPAIALVVGIISMYFYPITKEKFEQIKEEVNKLHREKAAKVAKQ